jgi:hypothetical protein
MPASVEGERAGSAIEPLRPSRQTTTRGPKARHAPSPQACTIEYRQVDGVTPEQVQRVLARVHAILFGAHL